MRIRQISVSNLFGLFDHTIPLHLDEKITIVHAPNGLGKTIILRMLAGLINGHFSIFRRVPFARFTVDFDSGESLHVHTEDPRESRQQQRLHARQLKSVILTATGQGLPDDSYTVSSPQERSRQRMLTERIEHLVPNLTRASFNSWHHDTTGERLSLEDVLERYAEHLHLRPEDVAPEPERITQLRQAVHVLFIRTQRLDAVHDTARKEPGHSPRLTVEQQSDDLTRDIRGVLEKYATVSQKLDRSFPLRLFREQGVVAMEVSEISDRLRSLENRRGQLKSLGLLDLDEGLPDVPATIIESKRDVFSIYVSDVEDKLAVFDDMAKRIDLLTGITNQRFLYKKLRVTRESGYVIKSDTGEHLSPGDLSSGEQHELVLLYELIFKLKSNSIVLIDEPEISLHIGWQQHFLPDLKKIVALSGFDVLIATHSPEIIGDHWRLTVELKGPPAAQAL